jgi:hypothetical protein
MDPTYTSRLRQPFVMFACTVLLLVGAGIAGARTQGGHPLLQSAGSCDTTETTETIGATDEDNADDEADDVAEDADEADDDQGEDESEDADEADDDQGEDESEDADEADEADGCETEDSDDAGGNEDVGGDVVIVDHDPVQADVEDYFATFDNDCGAAFLGEYDLGEENTLAAFDDLVVRLDAGQTSHGVQSVRVLLRNCEDHANDGLMNALYHHGLNWVKHYDHEQWLQDKFANKWPDGKPGNSEHDKLKAEHEKAKTEQTHGNPHTTSSGASSHGNGYGHSK